MGVAREPSDIHYWESTLIGAVVFKEQPGSRRFGRGVSNQARGKNRVMISKVRCVARQNLNEYISSPKQISSLGPTMFAHDQPP
jgi:hypothetical protein